MLLAGPISHTSTQYIDFVDFLHFNGSVYQLFCSFSGCWASFVCSCHSILGCCVAFCGVKLSIRSFVLFLNMNSKLEILANFEFLGVSSLSRNRS